MEFYHTKKSHIKYIALSQFLVSRKKHNIALPWQTLILLKNWPLNKVKFLLQNTSFMLHKMHSNDDKFKRYAFRFICFIITRMSIFLLISTKSCFNSIARTDICIIYDGSVSLDTAPCKNTQMYRRRDIYRFYVFSIIQRICT